jgi:hypothetical protein
MLQPSRKRTAIEYLSPVPKFPMGFSPSLTFTPIVVIQAMGRVEGEMKWII